MASNSDGSGGANRRRSMRISQGDTVMIQKYGGKRGISIITGILPKSKDTVHGSGRFDAKSGYFGDLQAKVCLEVNKNLVKMQDMKLLKQHPNALIKIRPFLLKRMKKN